MNNQLEQFRLINGYPNYQVSNHGRVMNAITGRILSLRDNGNGYKIIQLGKGKNHYVHRLVAYAFIENPNNYTIIDHLNKVRYDNNVNNLRWCNQSMNLKNRSANKKNLTGICGVTCKKTKKGTVYYLGKIKNNEGKYISKSFQTLIEARQWRRQQEQNFGGYL